MTTLSISHSRILYRDIDHKPGCPFCTWSWSWRAAELGHLARPGHEGYSQWKQPCHNAMSMTHLSNMVYDVSQWPCNAADNDCNHTPRPGQFYMDLSQWQHGEHSDACLLRNTTRSKLMLKPALRCWEMLKSHWPQRGPQLATMTVIPNPFNFDDIDASAIWAADIFSTDLVQNQCQHCPAKMSHSDGVKNESEAAKE